MAREKSELDRLLDDLLKGKSPKEILGQDGLLDELTKRLVERALEGEMTAHLGYEKHAPEGRNRGNSRNGSGVKRVKTGTSELEVEVPRDRDGSFEPQLLPKRRRRLPGFDDKVLALYARGLTTREIQGHLKEIYGVDVSPSLVSAVTDSVMADVEAWQSRPLDAVYPIVYLDALHLKIRENRHVQPCAVYLALGIDLEGHKDLLGLWLGETEGAKVLARGAERAQEPRGRGHPDRRRGRAEGVPGGDSCGLPAHADPALHRAHGAQLARLRELEPPHCHGPGSAHDLHGRHGCGGGTGARDFLREVGPGDPLRRTQLAEPLG